MHKKKIYTRTYVELETALTPLGFNHIGGGKFTHPFLPDYSFDLSASSVEGAMSIIFNKGFALGAESARSEMRQALGIDA